MASGRTSSRTALLRVGSSLAVGGLTYALSLVAGQSRASAVMISVFVAGAVLVVQYLSEFERRLSLSEKNFERSIEKLTEIGNLTQGMERSALGRDETLALLRKLVQLGADNYLNSAVLRSEIRPSSDMIDNMLAEQGTYDGERDEWLLTLALNSTSSIEATSTSPVDGGSTYAEGGFWVSELGVEYLDIQKEARRRGVHVRRIFVLENRTTLDDLHFLRLCRDHRIRDIGLKVLLSSSMPKRLQGRYDDFVLVDKRMYYGVRAPVLNRDRSPSVARTRLSSLPVETRRASDLFAELWGLENDENTVVDQKLEQKKREIDALDRQAGSVDPDPTNA